MSYVRYRVAKVAIELCTRAEAGEVSRMVSKGRKVKFGKADWGWGRPRTIYLKVRGDRQSRRFFFWIWHPPRAQFKDVRNSGDRPRKRRWLAEPMESRKEQERTKRSQGKHKEEESFQGLLNFAIRSSLFITKVIMFFMPNKDHTAEQFWGGYKGNTQTVMSWEMTEWGELSLNLG